MSGRLNQATDPRMPTVHEITPKAMEDEKYQRGTCSLPSSSLECVTPEHIKEDAQNQMSSPTR